MELYKELQKMTNLQRIIAKAEEVQEEIRDGKITEVQGIEKMEEFRRSL